MTVTEAGVTSGFAQGFREAYDFTSGMLFDTSPMFSGYGLSGYYYRQYVDAFYRDENYDLKNLLPVNY